MIRAKRSLAYGPNPRQTLDLYLPNGKSEEPRPVLFYFYGGSWQWGSRRHYELLGRALTRLGFVVAIPDYRFYPDVKFPTFIEDLAEAVTWVLARSDEFNIDPARTAFVGHSAGAHMAACLILDPSYLENLPQLRITHLAGISGPYSTDMTKVDSVSKIFSHVTDVDRTRPIKLVANAPQLPKVLLLHGAKDETVNQRNTLYMRDALNDRSAEVTAHILEDLGHRDIIIRAMPGFRWRSQVWRKIRSFLQDLDA